MAGDRNAEGLAWEIVTRPAPKGRYEHADAYRAREGKRIAFRQRVRRSPGGCWVWVGKHLASNGRAYPMYYHRRDPATDPNPTRSAFLWMMREFFPDVPVRQYEQTTTRCGRDLCVNPYHRVRSQRKSPNVMSHDLVREIYAWRGSSTVTEVAKLYDQSTPVVSRIWTGQRWSSVTGWTPEDTPKMGADKAMAVYELRGSGRTQKSVADEFGVSQSTVSNIWNGLTRANRTGQPRRYDEEAKPTNAQLDEATRQAILDMKGEAGKRAVAAKFGVGASTVLRIWNGRREGSLRGEQGA